MVIDKLNKATNKINEKLGLNDLGSVTVTTGLGWAEEALKMGKNLPVVGSIFGSFFFFDNPSQGCENTNANLWVVYWNWLCQRWFK